MNNICDDVLTELQNEIATIQVLSEYYDDITSKYILKTAEVAVKYSIGANIGKSINAFIMANPIYEKDLQEKLSNIELENKENIKHYLDITIKENNSKDKGSDNNYDISYSMSDNVKDENKKFYDPMAASKEIYKNREYNRFVIDTILTAIIVTFEEFLSKIYTLLVVNNPKCYFKDRTIKVVDIINKDFNEIINNEISQEVTKKMFDSIECLKSVCEIENISINKYEDLLKSLFELNERRNIFIHNKGIVNDIYINNIMKYNETKLKKGEYLETEPAYITGAIDLLYKLVLTLSYEICEKYNEKDNKKWVDKFMEISFNLLKDKKYIVSKHIHKILSKCNFIDFETRTIFRVNYINSCKQLGETNVVKDELAKLDLSIAKDEFKIAKLCLEDKNKEVYDVLSANDLKPFDAQTLEEWPLFINFRETEYYNKLKDKYKDLFMKKKYVDENIDNHDKNN